MAKLSTHQRRARDFIQREQWDEALSELRAAIGMDVSNPTLHNQMGDIFLRKEEITRACKHFEQAIDLYADLRLHNNAVALCRKVMRLCPSRVEVRYRLARLRFDQGLNADAVASFLDYLRQQPTSSEEDVLTLEERCREIVEVYSDAAPVGKILERLEQAQSFRTAFEIVQRLAQRAADAGDDAAAARYTEKMRSLRVLVEGAGGGDILSESAAGVADAVAPDVEESPPVEIDADAASIDASGVGPEPPSGEAAVAAAESEAPEIDLQAYLADSAPSQTQRFDSPPSSAPSPGEEEVEIDFDVAETALPSIESAPESGALAAAEEAVAEEKGDSLDAFLEAQTTDTGVEPLDPARVDAEPEIDAPEEDVPEYEIPETSLDDVAALIGEESPAPPVEPSPPRPVDALSPPPPPPPGATTPPEPSGSVDPAPPTPQPPPVVPVAPPATSPAPPPKSVPAPPTAGQTVRSEPPTAPAPPPPPATLTAAAPASTPATDPDWGSGFRHPVWIPDSDTDDPELKRAEGGRVHELEDVIGTFREQMAQALGDDASARYDLGVAYYEMGLYNEALAEFEVAVRKASIREQCLEMMAACLTMQGRHADIVALLTPLLSSAESAGVGLGLRYTMGVAYEALGRREEARRHFEAVALVDSGYRDVQARLQRF
ncbi:MAG: tetratricopeptide repeat protein [Candidatus Latescibacterota bacterium]|nr:MAG: tetratricopeptide repeat protein [Candidatus Latescibacterota bacterium]